MNAFGKTLCVAAMGAGLAAPGLGDDIQKAILGKPDTRFQIDSRLGLGGNDKGTETCAGNVILKFKYPTGKHFGMWGFVNAPWKEIHSPKGGNSGLGDVTLGAGPRGNFNIGEGEVNWLSYGGLTLPTGDYKDGVPLGNGRADTNTGAYATWMPKSKNYEIDAALERKFTDNNWKGINPPDEWSGGLMFGKKIGDFRCGIGVNGTRKDNGDYQCGVRGTARYIPKGSRWHYEISGDYGIGSRNMPKNYGISFRARCNI